MVNFLKMKEKFFQNIGKYEGIFIETLPIGIAQCGDTDL